MLGAMDLAADYSECSCGEQAAQIAVAKVRAKAKSEVVSAPDQVCCTSTSRCSYGGLALLLRGQSPRFGHARGMSANPPTAAQ